MIKYIFIVLSLFCIVQVASVTVYTRDAQAMTMMKKWINKIRPNTFPEVVPQKQKVEKSLKDGSEFSQKDLEIIHRLKEKEDSLNQRELALKSKSDNLQKLSQQVESKLDRLAEVIRKTEALRDERKKIEEKDISKIVIYYNAMDPENIAPFFNQMDRLTATQILMRMQAKKAAAVMQLLDPKVAVEITEKVTRFKSNKLESITNER